MLNRRLHDEGNTSWGDHTKIESTESYLELDVDDALELAEQTEVQMGRRLVGVPSHVPGPKRLTG